VPIGAAPAEPPLGPLPPVPLPPVPAVFMFIGAGSSPEQPESADAEIRMVATVPTQCSFFI
jgi:hypothetical protein